MLIKLLKYDLKYMIKNMCVFYILSIFFAIITRLLSLPEQTVMIRILSKISSGCMIAMIANIVINVMMRSWVRFRDSLYKDEAYLTHTLPVTKNDLYNSKFIQTLIFFFIGFIIVLLSLFVAYYTPDTWQVIKEYIKTIGLFNSKAENIIKTCRDLVEKHHSQVPENREALEALAGVGRKTANVILNTAFGHPTIAVDTHIFRVANRTGFAPGKDVVKVEEKLNKVVPSEFKVDVHHWLILHGRYTCIARKPRCGSCIIEDLCEYKEKTNI